MALALSNAARLTADIRLAQAVSNYEASLSDAQKAEFRTLKYKTRTTAPCADDVMKLTAEMDRQAGQNSRAWRCFGPRFTNVLRSVQQYAALGDIVIGGSQNIVASGVWCVIRTSLLLLTRYSSYLERFSTLFMNIGRSSPRYQDLALLYSNSVAIRRYLAEYFIVVVDICHRFLTFSQKSVFGQLKSSLVDADLHQAETKLEEWALNIKDEAEILSTRTLVGEARESSGFRALFDSRYRKLVHQHNIKRRMRWSDACTRYDHETPWKQARKCGNTSIFVHNANYQEWKSQHQSSTLVLRGKLGSGKTILAANVVDELHLTANDTVCYFFCRHDIMYSCLARTIVGSLCRQLLSGHINEDTMDEFLGECVQSLSFDDVVRLTKNVLSRKRRCYFILDGLDECEDIERGQITEALHEMQKTTQLLVFISLRSQVDQVETEFRCLRPHFVFEMPEENPDISYFILRALKEKIETGKLVLGDQSLILEIRDALEAGAQGMFLWVVLQIDCLCMEQTDEAIREALRNLPPDLSTTYDRILRRSSNGCGHSYQKQILSFLLATLRPLGINELREALAVVPGDTEWKPDNQVNNIYHALACCESLVIVTEEERTVHFVHQSVMQFLLDQNSTSTALHFDLVQASLELGEVCVTYLNYGIFDQDLSTNVVPTIPAGVIPTKIARNTLRGKRSVGQLALMLLNLQPTDGPEIGKIMAETGRVHRKRQGTAAFEFLKYASQHWLIHTTNINHSHRTFSLWKGLLQHSKFDGLVWGPNKIHPDKLLVDEQSGNIWTLAPRVTWAISHSHLPLLMFELRSRRGLKAFCSIIPYIRILVRAGDSFKFDASMALKLFQVAVVGKADDIANLILRTDQTSYSREAFLDPFVKQSDLARIGWIISLKWFGTLLGLETPIVELACRARNLHILNLALSLGARVDLYDQNPLVLLLETMRDPLDLALACRILEAGFPLSECEKIPKPLYWLLQYYGLINVHENFDPYRTVMSSLRAAELSTSWCICSGLISRACFNGNLQMVQKLLGDEMQRSISSRNSFITLETLSLWMMDTLRTYSTERREIVRHLLNVLNWSLDFTGSRHLPDDCNALWLDVFRRCVQLRAWELAHAIRRLPDLHAASFSEVLMNYSCRNRQRDGHDTKPTAGDVAQQRPGAAYDGHVEAEISIGASAQKTLGTDEHETTAFRIPNHISIMHLSASCRDTHGMKFLLEVLGWSACTILSTFSPLESCFGEVPLQILLSQEQLTAEETADFLEVGCMFLRRIGAHGSSACGQSPRSCVDLAPEFCAKVVQRITQQELEMLIPETNPERPWHDRRRPDQSPRTWILLQNFLKTWIAHLTPPASPRGLLMPVLDAIIRGFGEIKARFEPYLSEGKEQLRLVSKGYIMIGSVLVQILGAADFDDMIQLLLAHDPCLQDAIELFKELVFQTYNI